jgi:hypothetical protein
MNSRQLKVFEAEAVGVQSPGKHTMMWRSVKWTIEWRLFENKWQHLIRNPFSDRLTAFNEQVRRDIKVGGYRDKDSSSTTFDIQLSNTVKHRNNPETLLSADREFERRWDDLISENTSSWKNFSAFPLWDASTADIPTMFTDTRAKGRVVCDWEMTILFVVMTEKYGSSQLAEGTFVLGMVQYHCSEIYMSFSFIRIILSWSQLFCFFGRISPCHIADISVQIMKSFQICSALNWICIWGFQHQNIRFVWEWRFRICLTSQQKQKVTFFERFSLKKMEGANQQMNLVWMVTVSVTRLHLIHFLYLFERWRESVRKAWRFPIFLENVTCLQSLSIHSEVSQIHCDDHCCRLVGTQNDENKRQCWMFHHKNVDFDRPLTSLFSQSRLQSRI